MFSAVIQRLPNSSGVGFFFFFGVPGFLSPSAIALLLVFYALVLVYEYQFHFLVITINRHSSVSCLHCHQCDPEEVNEAINTKHVEPRRLGFFASPNHVLLQSLLLRLSVHREIAPVMSHSEPADLILQV